MSRKRKQLAPQLSKRLLAYATIASAGAVAATPAAAEVVYTATHQTLQRNYTLDLNNDGIADFHLASSYISGFGKVEVTPLVFGDRIVASAVGPETRSTSAPASRAARATA